MPGAKFRNQKELMEVLNQESVHDSWKEKRENVCFQIQGGSSPKFDNCKRIAEYFFGEPPRK